MMLPEHVQMLREYDIEGKQEDKPELSEYDYVLLSEALELSYTTKADTKIKRWMNGEFIYNRGTIIHVDLSKRMIQLEDPFTTHAIKLDDIVDVTIMD